ncbi:MAG: hypothetical protein ACRYFL_03035, partial [Janthinobacterium lividum]
LKEFYQGNNQTGNANTGSNQPFDDINLGFSNFFSYKHTIILKDSNITFCGQNFFFFDRFLINNFFNF